MNLERSTALVTGASRGLGLALVADLLRRGVRRVYAATRTAEPHAALSALDHDRVVPLVADVTNMTQLRAAAARASDVDLVINNAGVLASTGVLESQVGELQRDLETNFFGVLAVARAFVPVLRPGSAIVNVLSVVSLASIPALGGYSASKAAAWSLTQSLRAELAPRGVRVHAAFPGPIDTDMIRALDLPKTPPAEVARALLDGVAADRNEIFPDPMSADVGATWAHDPRALERRFAG
jgi:NAD(P)-dependent dehydrogenase (short-subunit alcohol dehydrogenase family)